MNGMINFSSPGTYMRLLNGLAYGSIVIFSTLFFNGILPFETAVILFLTALILYTHINTGFYFRVIYDLNRNIEKKFDVANFIGGDGEAPNGMTVKEVTASNPEELEAALKEIQDSIMEEMAKNSSKKDKEE